MTSALTRGSANVPFSAVTKISPEVKLPSFAADSVKGPEVVDIAVGSLKSIATSPVVFSPVTSPVAPVIFPCATVTVTSTSSAFAWFVALPVNVTVI